MAAKRWVFKTVDHTISKQLHKELNINQVLCDILVKRGLTNYNEAKHFFRPQISDLHNPFLMKDMDKAVERIEQAIRNDERILIYGDYDVDGTTSVALVYSFLIDFYQNIEFYIPDRYKEGYGISFASIDYADENNCSLIIALDCGIKAVDKVKYAKEKGIDYIICDHHLPGDVIPDAYAILDPKVEDCEYPYKELSGCGIGFKLIQAFAEHNTIPFEEVEKQLDLVVVSIASDIVPITGENRTLAYYGLQKLNANPRPGLLALIELTALNKEITITDIVFVIGPRINAAGRMDKGVSAVQLLISEEEHLPEDKADELNKHNSNRKLIDSSTTEEAIKLIEQNEVLIARKSTVLYKPHWHKGVIGIVASRVMETYYRPTIILTESEGKVSGSARSVKGFNVYNAIEACSDYLEQFGGHKYAAGLTMKQEQVEAFSSKFEEVVSATIDEELLTPEQTIDAELNFTDITPKFYNIVRQFAPFGPGNMKPVFVSKNVKDAGGSKVVGEDHLKLRLVQNNSIPMDGIAFGFGKMAKKVINNGNSQQNVGFDICYTIEENEWRGKISLQLNVKDIKINKASEA